MVRFALVLACAGLAAGTAHAVTGTITYSFAPQIPSPPAPPGDAIEVDFATPLDTGVVFASDLTDLTLTLLDGGSAIYTEMAIVGGAVQPIAGLPRSIGDIAFLLDLGTLADFPPTSLFDNDVNVLQGTGGAVGTTYNLLYESVDNLALFSLYQGGEFIGGNFGPVVDITVALDDPAAIPLPAGLPLLLGGLAMLGFAGRRR